MAVPSDHLVFGKPNRPPTPVKAVISNNYGEQAAIELQTKYQVWKSMKNVNKGTSGIRMTNAQVQSDAFIKQKNTLEDPKPQFKLKRFLQVEPRTSTKRGPSKSFAQAANATLQPQKTEDLNEANE